MCQSVILSCFCFFYQYEQTFANSHEAILFRKFLQDRVQRRLLLRYLAIKQTSQPSSLISFHKQNIEFWLEVQRYKVHYHLHVMPRVVLEFEPCFHHSMTIVLQFNTVLFFRKCATSIRLILWFRTKSLPSLTATYSHALHRGSRLVYHSMWPRTSPQNLMDLTSLELLRYIQYIHHMFREKVNFDFVYITYI